MEKNNKTEQTMLYRFVSGKNGKTAPEVEQFIKSQVLAMNEDAEKDIVPMTVRMPKTVVNMMKIKATLLDTSVQDLIVELCKKWLADG